MVSSKNRNATAWSSRTGKRGKGKTLVELVSDAHAAYVEIYDRWLEAVGWAQHGLFGYERMMEAVQKADELMLLRIDCNSFTAYDFVEMVSAYWFITEDDLIAGKFDAVEVFCGSTI